MIEIQRTENIQEIFDDDEDKKEKVDSINHEVKDVSRNRVRYLRKSLGLSVGEFLDGIDGFSDYTLESIEKGNSGLTLDKALKISQKYDVSLDYLFGISDYINEKQIMSEVAFEQIFNIQFPLADNEGDPLLVLNFSTNEYLLEYFYNKKVLDQKKKDGEITQEAFDFELQKLREKYNKVLKSQSIKQVNYNCSKID
ncbi:MAG: helix-turn-helix transcriptional regulator [Bacilli bacterium]|nr:helix-turn-helix transcriptional regulator [Bacilli bacterium]